MSAEKPTSEQLTRYLLGEMSEAEQTDLEMRYFADPQLLAELCAWRNYLIDGYVSNRLSPSMQDRFESGIEKSWAMNERIRFAETLQNAIDGRGQTSPFQTPRQSVREFLVGHRVVVIVAVILVFLVAIWLVLRFMD